MLTKKQNLLETIRGGKPDRFVNQYEYLHLVLDPVLTHCGGFCAPGSTVKNGWGVTINWADGEPGPFPVLDSAHKVLPDITKWRDIVEKNAPDPHGYSEKEWDETLAELEKVDRNDVFVAPFSVNGLFEKLHYLMGMEDTMINMYEYPQETEELISFMTDWQIETVKEEMKRYHPDAVFQHDDWGTQDSMLMSPEMWRHFFKPAYQKLYGFWKKECGVDLIVHHSDSYAADVVPDMIEVGIDIFQGAVSENNIPKLLREYGGKISIHGGLDNGKLDKADWKKEEITAALTKLIRDTDGGKYLIPGMTMGGPGSTYPGVYDWVSSEIVRLSSEYFK